MQQPLRVASEQFILHLAFVHQHVVRTQGHVADVVTGVHQLLNLALRKRLAHNHDLVNRTLEVPVIRAGTRLPRADRDDVRVVVQGPRIGRARVVQCAVEIKAQIRPVIRGRQMRPLAGDERGAGRAVIRPASLPEIDARFIAHKVQRPRFAAAAVALGRQRSAILERAIGLDPAGDGEIVRVQRRAIGYAHSVIHAVEVQGVAILAGHAGGGAGCAAARRRVACLR